MSTRDDQVLNIVTAMGGTGATSADVEEMTGLGHGSASAALSRLTRLGRTARLRERREGATVYVLPADVGDREVAKPRVNKHRRVLEALAVEAEQAQRRADVAALRGLGKDVVDTHAEYAHRLQDLIKREGGIKP